MFARPNPVPVRRVTWRGRSCLAVPHTPVGRPARARSSSSASAVTHVSHTNHRVHRPHVVVLGGGFAGLAAARTLSRAAVDVTVVDRANHHLVQPLLPHVALAILNPSDVAVPIRWRLRSQCNATVLMAEALDIDPERRMVFLNDRPFALSYDYLVVATGSCPADGDGVEWEGRASPLATLEDAFAIRRRFLLAFERAERCDDERERARALTFVVVGGGPTGVELAALLPCAARDVLRDDFRRIDTSHTRVLLVERGERLLDGFPADVAAQSHDALRRLGIEVRTGATVTRVEREAVWIGGERIAASAVFWAAGTVPSPLAKRLGGETAPDGRVRVGADLALPARREIFVVGDLCAPAGVAASPAMAHAAMRTGRHAAMNILRDLAGRERIGYRLRSPGSAVTLGRGRAVGAFLGGRVRASGAMGWWLWLVTMILPIAGVAQRPGALLSWAYAYVTQRRGVRLITGDPRDGDGPGSRAAGVRTRSAEGVRARTREGSGVA
jgi:NADH dehydrogenase